MPTGDRWPHDATPGEKVKAGRAPAYEPKSGGRNVAASAATYVRHTDLEDDDYHRLLTLQKHKGEIVEKLGGDLDHIEKEDTDRRYRMPHKAAKRLDKVYREIAKEYGFYEEVDKKMLLDLDQDTYEAIRAEAKARKVPMKRVAREWMRAGRAINRKEIQQADVF